MKTKYLVYDFTGFIGWVDWGNLGLYVGFSFGAIDLSEMLLNLI